MTRADDDERWLRGIHREEYLGGFPLNFHCRHRRLTIAQQVARLRRHDTIQRDIADEFASYGIR